MNKYYSRVHLENIKTAANYQELLEVALDVLESMRSENPLAPIAMLCGPISTGGKGSRQENLEVFELAIERASAGGLLVFSQMPFEENMDRIYKSDPKLQGLMLLERFYRPIFKSGIIKLLCFIDGWEESVGAQWEYNTAVMLNIPRIYLSQFYTR